MVRSAEVSDADAIAPFHVDGWPAAYRGLLGRQFSSTFGANRARTWCELLRDTSEAALTLLTVDDADRIAGFCALSAPSRGDDAHERTSEVAATYVPGATGGPASAPPSWKWPRAAPQSRLRAGHPLGLRRRGSRPNAPTACRVGRSTRELSRERRRLCPPPFELVRPTT